MTFTKDLSNEELFQLYFILQDYIEFLEQEKTKLEELKNERKASKTV